MFEILYRLIIGHNHKWKILKVVPCSGNGGSLWDRYYLQCEHCGKIKIKDPL